MLVAEKFLAQTATWYPFFYIKNTTVKMLNILPYFFREREIDFNRTVKRKVECKEEAEENSLTQ